MPNHSPKSSYSLLKHPGNPIHQTKHGAKNSPIFFGQDKRRTTFPTASLASGFVKAANNANRFFNGLAKYNLPALQFFKISEQYLFMKDKGLYTALEMACFTGDLSKIKFIIDYINKFHLTNSVGSADKIFLRLIEKEQIDLVKELFYQAKANHFLRPKNLDDLLEKVIDSRNDKMCEFFLEEFDNFLELCGIKEDKLSNAFEKAIEVNNLNFVDAILKRNLADSNKYTRLRQGTTPIKYAKITKNYQLEQILVKHVNKLLLPVCVNRLC